MPLKKFISEAEGASEMAKKHLPTHPSKAAKQMPDNSELSKHYGRPNDVGSNPLHSKHLPIHASDAKSSVPDEFHEGEEHDKEEEMYLEALAADAEDAHVKHKAVSFEYDGQEIANRMKDGVFESEEEDEEKLAVEDASLDAYNDEVLGEEDELEIEEEEDELAIEEEEDEESKKEVEEHVSLLVSNEKLSENFKRKTATLFEAAVREQVSKRSKKLQEKYQEKLKEAKRNNLKKVSEELSSFVDYVVEEWLKENEIAIEQSIEVQLAESFFDGIKNLFEQHNIVVPQEKVNLLNDLSEEKQELESKLNEAINTIVDLRKKEESRRKRDIISECSKGLSETEKEKLFALSEGFTFLSDSEFSERVETIKESYFPSSVSKMKDMAEVQVENPIQNTEKKPSQGKVNPNMESYLSALSRLDKYSK